MKKEQYPPLALMKKAIKYFPDAWSLLEFFHNENGKNGLPEWDSYCYVPISGAIAVATNGRLDVQTSELLKLGNWPAILAALAPWRLNKEVYKFDVDLENTLYEQANEDINIPSEIFYNLPFRCLYIECNNLHIGKQKCAGFFVHIEHDTKNQDKELRLLFINDSLETIAFPMHLNTKTISENWSYTKTQGMNVSAEAGMHDYARKIGFSPEFISDAVAKALQLVLFICASNTEIAPHSEQQFITKRTDIVKDRYAEIRKWNVGVRFGNAIRASQKNPAMQSRAKKMSGERSSPRPHSRRAHWHHFWTGAKNDPESRKLILKWVAPTYVGEVDLDNDPVIIRPVKK